MGVYQLAAVAPPDVVATAPAVMGLAAGFGLTLAGTLLAALLRVPARAWGRRAVVGAAAGMLAWGLGSAAVAAWRVRLLEVPAWFWLTAPLLGALGGLLGGLLEGAGGAAEDLPVRRDA